MSDTKLTGFYFPWPNLGIKLSRQWANLRSNTEKEAPLIRAAYVDPQPSSANDPGNHDLSGWAIGERDFRNRFRIWYDKSNDRFSIQFNSGTEAVEVWDDYLSIRQVDGRVTVHGYGGLDSSNGGFYSPVPRNLAVSSTFTPAATEWAFTHNLDTKPVLWQAFNMEDKSVTPQTVDVSDPNTAYFYFAVAQAGRAMVVAEQARGEGIRVTDGSNGNVFTGATRLGFNPLSFYLSNEGHGDPVVNLMPISLADSQHSDLAGLTDDDHPQYALTDGSRTITGDQTFASEIIVQDKVRAGSFYSPVFGEVAYANQGYLSVEQTNGEQSFNTVNSLKFEYQNFYITADSNGKPVINFRGPSTGSGNQFGTGITSQSFTSSPQWTFSHGLGVQNLIWATYDDQGEAIIPDKVATSDANVTYFYFTGNVTGRAVVAGGPLVNTITVKGNVGTSWNASTGTLSFSENDFYITADANGKPVINSQPSAGGAGVTDHGALTGLSDDDHSQYLLATQATDRSTFTTNWADLTDGGVTSLHSHADSGGGGGFYGVNFRETDGSPNFRNDTIYFNSDSFYLTPNSAGKPVLNLQGITGGSGVTAHSALTGLSADDHAQYLLASDATSRASFAANWLDLTDGGTTTLHSHAASDPSPGFYAKMASGAEFGDTIVFADTDFNKSGQVLTVDETGLDHSQLANLTTGDPHTQYVLKTEASPGFYGVNFRETDGNPPGFRNDTIYFNSDSFYLTPNSVGKPILNLRGVTGGGGLSSITVQDIDANPSIAATTIQFTNGTVTDQGGGVAEVTISAGGGISTVTIGGQSFGSQTTLGLNAADFYLSGGATSKVLNLRNDQDTFQGQIPQPTLENYFVVPTALHAYTVLSAEMDSEVGTATVGFYIVSASNRVLPGRYISGMDPIAVSTTRSLTMASNTAAHPNTMNVGDRLVLSIYGTNSARHVTYTVRVQKT